MKKTISLLFIALIICSSVLTLNINAVQAQNGSSVSGIISSDTTWTKENSPYNFTGDALVDTNVTLVIEPGVTVNFNAYFLQIRGTLTAKGTETEKIIMLGSGIAHSEHWGGRIAFLSTSVNSTLAFVEIKSNPDVIIHVSQSSPTIENCVISGNSGTALSITVGPNGIPAIQNNIISNNGRGISIDIDDFISYYGVAPIICNNTITNNLGSGIAFYNGQALIYDNIISNNSYGIYCSNSQGALISDNVITSNSYGIYCGNDISCSITGNTISNNTQGISLDTGIFRNCIFNINKNLIINNYNAILLGGNGLSEQGNITSNTIAKNKNGIVSAFGLDIVISQNNIYENTNYTVKVSHSDLNVSNNWWGTTNTTVISQSIYDFYDDFNLGKVVFSPFLNNSSPTAPTIPTFNVSANAGVGGSIDPNGITPVCYGSNQTYRISPDTGYHILDVAVNGTSVGRVSIYNIQDITGATTISATFTPDPTPTPTPTATPTPKPTASPTPSPSPAQSPTATPTATPTQSPTSNPTTNTTQQPTTNPTQNVVTPTPTVPEYSALVIVPLLLSLLSIAMLFKHKKRA